MLLDGALPTPPVSISCMKLPGLGLDMMLAINDHNRKSWILAAMGGVLALVVLDETVVGVALPTIRDDLRMSQINSHWVVNAYLLIFTGFAAAGGKLHDVINVRRLFLTGVLIFALRRLPAELPGMVRGRLLRAPSLGTNPS